MNKKLILLLALICQASLVFSLVNSEVDTPAYSDETVFHFKIIKDADPDTWDIPSYNTLMLVEEEKFDFPFTLHFDFNLSSIENMTIENDLNDIKNWDTDTILDTYDYDEMLHDYPLILYGVDDESIQSNTYQQSMFYAGFNLDRQIVLGYVNYNYYSTRRRNLQNEPFPFDYIHLNTEEGIPENELVQLDFVVDFEKTQIWVDGILSAEGPGVTTEFIIYNMTGFVTMLQYDDVYDYIDFSYAFEMLDQYQDLAGTPPVVHFNQDLEFTIQNIARWNLALDEEDINFLYGDPCLTRKSNPFEAELSQIYGYDLFSPAWSDKLESWTECYKKDCRDYFISNEFCGSDDLQRFIDCASQTDACKGQWTEPKLAKCIHKCYNTVNSAKSQLVYDYLDCQLFCKKTLHAGEIVSIILASVAVFFSLIFWGLKFSGILAFQNFAKVEQQQLQQLDSNVQKQQQLQPQNQQQQQVEDKTVFADNEIF